MEYLYWRNKAKDLKSNAEGCLNCQKKRDSRENELGNPASFQISDRRYGSIETNLLYHCQRLYMTASVHWVIEFREGFTALHYFTAKRVNSTLKPSSH